MGVRSWLMWVIQYVFDLIVCSLVTVMAGLFYHFYPCAISDYALRLCVGMSGTFVHALPFAYLVLQLRGEKGALSFLLIFSHIGFLFGVVLTVLEGAWWSCNLCIQLQDEKKGFRSPYCFAQVGFTTNEICNEYFGLWPTLANILRVLPPINCAEMFNILTGVGGTEDVRKMINSFAYVADEGWDHVRLLFPMATDLGLYNWHGLPKRIFYAFFCGIIYLIMVILIDHYDWTYKYRPIPIQESSMTGVDEELRKNKVAEASPNPMRVVDGNVEEERRRVEVGDAEGDLSCVVLGKCTQDEQRRQLAVLVSEFHPASASACLVLTGQVDILSGRGIGERGRRVDGWFEGKSTVFRLLTGWEERTWGSGQILGRELWGGNVRGWARFRGTSYCPQPNTLFPGLTAPQHLRFVALIRGLPSSAISIAVDSLIRDLGLGAQAKKRASEMSGGNQRKLQVAISLLDTPAVILLDEPTAGMDPGARRLTWEAVGRATRAGSAVVLTSHSMGECEALCGRLAVMVAGSFQCLGSPQALKTQFGDRLYFKARLGSLAYLQRVQESLESELGYCRLVDAHGLTLQYEMEMKEPGGELSSLFQVLTRLKLDGSLTGFLVSQTTLEQIFLRLARLQEDSKSGLVMDMAVRTEKHGPGGAALPPRTPASVETTVDERPLEDQLLTAISSQVDLLRHGVERETELSDPVQRLLVKQQSLVTRLLNKAPNHTRSIALDPMSTEEERKERKRSSNGSADKFKGRKLSAMPNRAARTL